MLHASQTGSSCSCRGYQGASRSTQDYIRPDPGLQSKSVRIFILLPFLLVNHCRISFDIDDRKGLEIVILTALLTFQDANDSYHSQGASSNPLLGMGIRRRSSAQGSVENTSPPPPPPPPKPARKTGVDRIAEMQAIRGEYNEITIEDEGNIDDYAQYCLNLFEVKIWACQCNWFSTLTRVRRMMLCCSSPSSQQLLNKFPKFFKLSSKPSE